MKIEILCNDGSPLGVTLASIHGEDGRIGVGGAELALLTMCEAWHKRGDEVILYNNPTAPENSPFEQRAIAVFNPNDKRDVLIIFRSPNGKSDNANGYKVWWSTDQHTVGNFKKFAKTVQKIVTISPHHSDYFRNMYGIQDTVSIDLPVRTWEYDDDIEKVPRQCIFSSIPDRGLMNLHAIWPLILQQVPDASLVITSDWRLWGTWFSENEIRRFRLRFAKHENVNYLGAIKRRELIKYQMSSDLHLYPCVYDELFCISVAESQVAGAFPITSGFGALPTTNMGIVLDGNPHDPKWVDMFVANAVSMLTDDDLKSKQQKLRKKALKRFSVERIMKEWDKNVFLS